MSEVIDRPLLKVEDLVTSFPVRRGVLRRVQGQIEAVAGVSLALGAGETLGIVGESGCGKSTLARTIVGLESPQSGRLEYKGQDLAVVSRQKRRTMAREIQMVFQDPHSSLNPWMTVRQLIMEAWEIHGMPDEREAAAEVGYLLELVGLAPDHADRYPHQFSGGQRQRIGIARALALRPQLIVCDEPVSALDVSIQAQILNLLRSLQEQLSVSYVFISHDLSVVRNIAHKVAVMYLGKIVEYGDAHSVYSAPAHPYTQALMSAVPDPEPWLSERRTRIPLTGDLPSPANPPSGCRFRTRCWKATEYCSEVEPELALRGTGHLNACHYAEPWVVTPVSPTPDEVAPSRLRPQSEE